MAAEAIRKLKNDIELAGGQRLRDIPALDRTGNRLLDVEAAGVRRYHDQLRKCEIEEVADSRPAFAALRQRLERHQEAARQTHSRRWSDNTMNCLFVAEFFTAIFARNKTNCKFSRSGRPTFPRN